MPQPTTTIFYTIVFTSLFLSSEASHSCAHHPKPSSSRSNPPCPPFPSTPPYPFSQYPSCGHPSFPTLHCSHPHSTITINHHRFNLLDFSPNSSSLFLSIISSNTSSASHSNCSSASHLPRRPISLSNSPFHISTSSCSRLQLLQPCPNPNLPNCSHCPFQCQIIKSPSHLLQGCESETESGFRRANPDQGCQSDVLEYLTTFFNGVGIEVEWAEKDPYFSSCKKCQSGDGACGFDSSKPSKPFFCFKRDARRRNHSRSTNLITALSSIFAVLSLILLIAVATVKLRSLGAKSVADSSEDPTTLFLRRQRSASLLPPVFTYDELESATNMFDQSRKLGDGGFGSVYLAQLKDGRIAAVKHLHRHPTRASAAAFTKLFCNEILILSSLQHPNMVRLHGYCSDPRGLLLVYDYVSNGTLADHLHRDRSLLTWRVRLEMAIQVATAIEYLHFEVKPPVVHRDVTSSNIFVETDMKVKLGDFGLSRLMVGCQTASLVTSGSSWVTTSPQGTPGYLDPDYYRSFRLTEKSDVYSFGVVLMELITGMRAVDGRRERREMALADLVVVRIQTGRILEVVDPGLVVFGEVVDGVEAVAELAFRCVAADKDDRPDMVEVVAELRRIRGGGVVSRHSCSNFDGLAGQV